MPIRVEHGPNLAPVGQLAYQTGQLEYRNKRRTELERLAMQQAEMRQRAQQQQNQIAATLQGQKMSYMGAMQRLQLGQQFGQINAEQAAQVAAKVAAQAQENKLILSKQLGQNQFDLANLNAGLADQKTIQNIQNAQRWKDAQINLNPAGEAEYLSIGKQIAAMRIDPKIPPQELEGSIAQLEQKRAALRDQEEFTSGIENKLGNKSIHTAYDDGSAKSHRVVVGHGNSGEPIVEYPIATTRIITDEGGNQTEEKLTPQEIYDATWTTIEQDGQTYRAEWDKKDGQYKVAPGTQPTVTPYMKELEDYKESHSDWMKDMFSYNSARAKLYPDYLTAVADEETTDKFAAYASAAMGPPPVEPVKPVDPDAPAVPLEQQPVAPVAPPQAGGIGGPVQQPQAQAPVSKEFEAVPPEHHPQKQWGDTPIKSTPEGYKAMGPVSIYAIAPEDQQAVYQERQREAKILPWDSEERGGVSPGTIANALKNGPLEYGAKVDLSKDNSPFSAKWKEETGSDVLVINDNLMFKLLSPGLTAEQQAELQQRIYTQKKKHFEYYGEPSDFPSANVQRFQQRAQGIQ